MVYEVLAGLKIAVVGDFGTNWPQKKIIGFINNNGGRVVSPKDRNLTHIVCTVKAYEQNSPSILEALKHGVHVVSFDWLEDSLQNHRKRRESMYSIKKIAKERRLAKQKRDRARKLAVRSSLNDFAYSVAEAKRVYHLVGYETYYDPSGFKYDITLVRVNILDNRVEKCDLKLHVTHEAPHYYACMSSEYLRNGLCSRVVEAAPPSEFKDAFEAFRRAFKAKTFKDWDDRADAKQALLEDGSVNPVAFSYTPPQEGPIGMSGPVVVDDQGFLGQVSREAMRMPPEPEIEVVRVEVTAHSPGADDEELEDEDEDEESHDRAPGVVEGNWGVVSDKDAAAEQLANRRYELHVEEEREKQQRARVRQEFDIARMNMQPDTTKVTYGSDGKPMARGVMTTGWGGSVTPRTGHRGDEDDHS